jgi:hypothetical protein
MADTNRSLASSRLDDSAIGEMTSYAKKLVGILGVILVLGGIAHSVGVTHRYLTKGLPDHNRVLLDVWIAEAQLVGGVLLLVGRKMPAPRPWLVAAGLVVWTWAIPFLPVLVHRAKPIFWVMPTLYSLACLAAIRSAGRQ